MRCLQTGAKGERQEEVSIGFTGVGFLKKKDISQVSDKWKEREKGWGKTEGVE